MKAVTVTNTASKIVSAGNRDFLHLYNNGSEPIYLCYDGDSTNLTTANGLPVPPGGILFLDNDNNRNLQTHDVFAICATGPVDVRCQGVS
jgi:hypothetical protein